MAAKLTKTEINEALLLLPDWKYDGERAIAKTFTFSDHIEALGFVTKLAMSAEVMNHHPELAMVYNRVEVTLSTHDAGGVTKNDTQLAEKAEHYS